jgi:hypothetical protein
VRLDIRDYPLHGSANRALFIKSEGGYFDLAGHEEKCPSRFVDRRVKLIEVEIAD